VNLLPQKHAEERLNWLKMFRKLLRKYIQKNHI